MPKTHRSDFKSIHPIKAMDNPQNCYRCHEAKFCDDCHGKIQKSTFTIKSHKKTLVGQDYQWGADHSEEARRNLQSCQSCQSCHPDGNVCLPCHSAKLSVKINPHPKNWKGSNFKNASDNKTCRVCH